MIDTNSDAFKAALGALLSAMDGNSEGMSTPLHYALAAYESAKPSERDLIAKQAAEIAERKAGEAQMFAQMDALQDAIAARDADIERLQHRLARMTAIQNRTHKAKQALKEQPQ
jgi:hypothetical protein